MSEQMTPLEIAIDQQRDRDWSEVMATDAGRRVVWDILDHCGLFRNPYRGDTADTNHACGQQSVAQWILDTGIAPNGSEILGEMMHEHAIQMDRIEAEIEQLEQNDEDE